MRCGPYGLKPWRKSSVSMLSDPLNTSAVSSRTALPVIDGLMPGRLIAPADGRETAEVLAAAAADGLAVAPIGGGTALGLGNLPERLDLALDTTKLRGVLEYEPTDLVISVGAGSRFAEVQATLAVQGQTLPVEVPRFADATVGGMVATALSGPRRLGSGTLRDLLIGISVAHPSGTVTRAGGMVVKNVTGFDLPRLYHGSLGTLGVIVSANFKVVPLPRGEATVLVGFPGPVAAAEAATRLSLSSLRPVALEIGRQAKDWFVAVRLEGREQAVRSSAAEVERILAGRGDCLTGPESMRWWEEHLAPQAIDVGASGNDVLVRCAGRPRALAALIEAAGRVAEASAFDVSYITGSVGLGTVVLRGTFPGGGSQNVLAEVQKRLLAVADHVTILAAPAEWKRGVDAWGRPPDALDVMRALKDQFDPHRVLNPGRFAGGI